MNFLHVFWKRLLAFGKSESIHSEMDEEFAFHIQKKAEDLRSRGVSEAEAFRIASASFGRQISLHEEGIAARGAGVLEDCWRDLHFSLRLLAKSRARTLILVATLAVSIAMSAAMFGVFRAVVLRPLPFDDAESLFILHQANRTGRGGVSYPHYRDWKAASSAFGDMAVFSSGDAIVSVNERAERLAGATISANVFALLRVSPLRGRLFRPEEDRLGGGEGGERPVLISEGYWRSRMGSREDIVGQHVSVDGFPFRIAGVIPSRFAFPFASRPISFWTTVAVDAEPFYYGGSIPSSRGYPRYDGVLARLRRGATASAAEADLKRIAAAVEKANPGTTTLNDIVMLKALDDLVGDTRAYLQILYGAVLAVLLVSCANASTLFLVTALSRRREFGIRSALGAQPSRLLRQVLLENTCLGLLSGLLAIPLSYALVTLCVALAPPETPRLADVRVDAVVFLYALGISLLTGLLAGCLPALFSMRRDVQTDLRTAGQLADGSRASMRAGAILIVAQIAVCTVLACGAGVLAQSFLRVLNTPRGFDPHSVTTATIDLPISHYPQGSNRVRNYYRSLIRELEKQPGIASVSIAERVPLSGGMNNTTFQIAGRERSNLITTDLCFVDEHYFDTLRIPLVSGRLIRFSDDEKHPPVAVVNRAFAQRFLSGESAEGKFLKLGWGGDAPKQIVGVIADLKNKAFDIQAAPQVYVPAAQFPNNGMAVLIRTSSSLHDAVIILRQAASRVDPSVPVDRVKTLDEYLVLSVATQRFLLALFILFAGSTVLIAAIGLYGLLAYATQKRYREFGIRMALGSRPAQLLQLVLRQGLILAAVGIAIGSLLAVPATRLMSQWLYETRPGDWHNLVLPGTVLLATAFAASFFPARRASRVDPLLAIRAE